MKPGPLYTININMRRLQQIHVDIYVVYFEIFCPIKGLVAKAISFLCKRKGLWTRLGPLKV